MCMPGNKTECRVHSVREGARGGEFSHSLWKGETVDAVHSRGLEGPNKAVVKKQSEQTYGFLDCASL